MKSREKNIIDEIDLFYALFHMSNQGYLEREMEFHKQACVVINKLLTMMDEPIGGLTRVFINSLHLNSFIKKELSQAETQLFLFWLEIERAVLKGTYDELANKVDQLIQEASQKPGPSPLPAYLLYPVLIKNIYLSGNHALIDVFRSRFPIPPAHVFEYDNLPDEVAKNEQIKRDVLERFVTRQTKAPQEIENGIMLIQRRWRSKRRQKEEIKRIKQVHLEDEAVAKQWISNAGVPYIPQCKDRDLARRIYEMAQKITLFESVYSVSATKHLKNILDEGLYGRRNLVNGFKGFVSSALEETDVKNGDGNVVCFGSNEVQTNLRKNFVKMTLDLHKLNLSNPVIFFKQKDFENHLCRVRKLSLTKGVELYFSHTDETPMGKTPLGGYVNDTNAVFALYQNGDHFGKDNNQLMSACSSIEYHSKRVFNALYAAIIPKPQLISYNVSCMHAILILNFFRFMDNLVGRETKVLDKTSIDYIEEFYRGISKLDDESLMAFLIETGSAISDTMEFNFYGAHLIDFDSLQRVQLFFEDDDKPSYTMHLSAFITQLQSGDMAKLDEARMHLPDFFKSHRFLDYLLKKVNEPAIVNALKACQQVCQSPAWFGMFKQQADGQPKGFSIERHSTHRHSLL